MDTTLWAITDEMESVGDMVAENGGELTEELEARLDAIEGAFEEKVERVALYVREMETRAEGAKAERQRLQAIEKAYAAKATGLKEYMRRCMVAAARERVETHRARVWVQRSGTPSIGFLGDVADLPPEYVRIVPESRNLDKKAIGEAIRAGEELPDGVTFTYSNYVRIG